jgi:hypothetical protein
MRLRVNIRWTCGQCHGCKSTPTVVQQPQPAPPTIQIKQPNQPFQVKQQPRMPFQQGPRLQPGKPWRPGGPGPGPIVRVPFPGPGPMVRLPGPGLRPVVRPDQPGPGFLVRPGLPILQPPDLPPLGITRVDPGRRLPEWMTQPKPDKGPEKSLLEGTPSFPGQPSGDLQPSAPPLPVLQGSIVQLNPLLQTTQGPAQPFIDQGYREVLPSEVVQAPPLAPLPGLRSFERGLLPTLDLPTSPERDPFDLLARPSPLELVLRAPPLPDLVIR